MYFHSLSSPYMLIYRILRKSTIFEYKMNIDPCRVPKPKVATNSGSSWKQYSKTDKLNWAAGSRDDCNRYTWKKNEEIPREGKEYQDMKKNEENERQEGIEDAVEEVGPQGENDDGAVGHCN